MRSGVGGVGGVSEPASALNGMHPVGSANCSGRGEIRVRDVSAPAPGPRPGPGQGRAETCPSRRREERFCACTGASETTHEDVEVAGGEGSGSIRGGGALSCESAAMRGQRRPDRRVDDQPQDQQGEKRDDKVDEEEEDRGTGEHRSSVGAVLLRGGHVARDRHLVAVRSARSRRIRWPKGRSCTLTRKGRRRRRWGVRKGA